MRPKAMIQTALTGIALLVGAETIAACSSTPPADDATSVTKAAPPTPYTKPEHPDMGTPEDYQRELQAGARRTVQEYKALTHPACFLIGRKEEGAGNCPACTDANPKKPRSNDCSSDAEKQANAGNGCCDLGGEKKLDY